MLWGVNGFLFLGASVIAVKTYDYWHAFISFYFSFVGWTFKGLHMACHGVRSHRSW